MRVTAALNDHPPIRHSFAIPLRHGGTAPIVISGHAYSDNVVRLARGADVLVHEVSPASSGSVRRPQPSSVVRHIPPPHRRAGCRTGRHGGRGQDTSAVALRAERRPRSADRAGVDRRPSAAPSTGRWSWARTDGVVARLVLQMRLVTSTGAVAVPMLESPPMLIRYCSLIHCSSCCSRLRGVAWQPSEGKRHPCRHQPVLRGHATGSADEMRKAFLPPRTLRGFAVQRSHWTDEEYSSRFAGKPAAGRRLRASARSTA